MQPTIGIDVSKATLDICLLVDGEKPRSKVFMNDPKVFDNILDWVKNRTKVSFQVGLEVTSQYHIKIATYLHEKGYRVAMINPFNARSYMRSVGNRNKTDPVDAYTIAQFTAKHDLPSWHPALEESLVLQERVRTLNDLQTTKQALTNRLEHDFIDNVSQRAITVAIDTLAEEIKTLESEIDSQIKSHEQLKKNFELLDSIPGIARKTAVTILSEVPDINIFSSSKKFAAFIGITPKQWKSGSSVNGTPGITRVGNGTLRKAFFFPSMHAKRMDSHLKSHFEALVSRGKTKKSALIAVMHQLARIVYGVLKSQQAYNPETLHTHNMKSQPKASRNDPHKSPLQSLSPRPKKAQQPAKTEIQLKEKKPRKPRQTRKLEKVVENA